METYRYIHRGSLGLRDPSADSIIDSDESTVIMGAQEEDTKSSIGGGDIDNPEVIAEVIEGPTLIEKAKFYTSLCLGTTAILAVFGFLFLIPFVVEPAITTILADFSPHAVACVVTEHVYAEGLKNCSWASCREGNILILISCIIKIVVKVKSFLIKLHFRVYQCRNPLPSDTSKLFENTVRGIYGKTSRCDTLGRRRYKILHKYRRLWLSTES